MKCNVCGQEIPDDSVFCPDCGAKVVNLKLIEEEKRRQEEQERLKREEERWKREEAARIRRENRERERIENEERERREKIEEEKKRKEEELQKWREEIRRGAERKRAEKEKKEKEKYDAGCTTFVFGGVWIFVWMIICKANIASNMPQDKYYVLLIAGSLIGIYLIYTFLRKD